MLSLNDSIYYIVVPNVAYSGHHINYPGMDVDLRSDQLLRLWIYSEHHTSVKPLTELGIGMGSSFPLYHMHVCLLEVT